MKAILLLVLIFNIVIAQSKHSQNETLNILPTGEKATLDDRTISKTEQDGSYYPLEVGNKWMFSRESNSVYFGYYKDYRFISITDSARIDGRKYFKSDESGSWFRYEDDLIYVYDGNTHQEYAGINFNIPTDSSYNAYLFTGGTQEVTNLQRSFSFFGSRSSVGIEFFTSSRIEQYWGKNIGPIRKYEQEGAWPYGYFTSKLISCLQINDDGDTIYYSHGKNPLISLNQIKLSLFGLQSKLTVSHPLDIIAQSFCFLDSIFIYHYLKKADDSTDISMNSKKVNNSGSITYNIDVDEELLNEGYELFIKYAVTDKSLKQHTTFHPEIGWLKFNLSLLDIPDDLNRPLDYSLSENYPNPFNPETKISYSLKKAGNVELIVYDVLGNEVAKLVNEHKPAGSYEVSFNGENLPSGVYIYRIKAGSFSQCRKMILLK